MATELSLAFDGFFPLFSKWADHPDPPSVTAVIDVLDNFLPKARNLLGKLPKPPGGVEVCNSGKRRRDTTELEHVGIQHQLEKRFLDGLFKTLFSLVSCIIDTATKLRKLIVDGKVKLAIELLKALQPLVKALLDNPGGSPTNDKPSGTPTPSATASSASDSSSSSSCTRLTVSDCTVACTATATTTLGGNVKRGSGSNEGCTTTCGRPITKCDATGATTSSTVTSTTTTYLQCARTRSPKVQRDPDSPTSPLTHIPKETPTPKSNSLVKRLIPRPLPGAGLVSFLQWQWDLMPVENELAHDYVFDPYYDMSSLTAALENVPNSWGLRGLHGCTSVVVISRKRIWISHIWEEPTMVGSQADFNLKVLQVLRLGDPVDNAPEGLLQYTGQGGDFANAGLNDVRAFIITPYVRRGHANPPGDELLNSERVDMIKDALTEILGHGVLQPIIGYTTWDLANDYHGIGDRTIQNHYGKVLITYDPQGWEVNDECNSISAALDLWFETGPGTLNDPLPQYTDMWFPFNHQILWMEHPIKMLKRQEGGECPLPTPGESIPSSASTRSQPTTLATSSRKPASNKSSSRTATTSSNGPSSSSNTPSRTPSSSSPVPSRTTPAPVKPTETWYARKCENDCGCCLDFYFRCKKWKHDECYNEPGSDKCIETCIRSLCWDNTSPDVCRYHGKCGAQMDFCPTEKKNGKRSSAEWQALDAQMEHRYSVSSH